MTQSQGFSKLLALRDLINEKVSVLESLPDVPAKFPDLNETNFSMSTEAFRKMNPQADDACRIIAAAAAHISAFVLPPWESIFSLLNGATNFAALQACLEGNVTEILREGGPQGVHAKDIGAKAGLDGSEIGRLLRVLATNHIYQEVSPDVFTNNRISSTLDTGKSQKEIVADPEAKHDNTVGFAGIVEMQMDEIFKSLPFLSQSLFTKSPFPSLSKAMAFNHAFNTAESSWEWLERPENAYRLKRFNKSMAASSLLQSGIPVVLDAFDWASLPQGSVFVDVGGGIGGMSLPLAKAHPHMKIVVQDRKATLDGGKGMWDQNLPDALTSGQVTLQPHDFFEPQPVKSPAAFFVKSILHDWSNDKSLVILKHLREAAGPATKLIVVDTVLPYASAVEDDIGIEGALTTPAPAPLLPNAAGPVMPYAIDIVMMACLGGQERTVYQFRDLLKEAGWRVIKVVRGNQKTFQNPVVAVPI